MRSLIADDEESGRERLRRMLAVHSDVVIVGEARDGVHAVQQIEKLRPDLLFLDIEMPGLGGFECSGAPRPCRCRSSSLSPVTTSTRSTPTRSPPAEAVEPSPSRGARVR